MNTTQTNEAPSVNETGTGRSVTINCRGQRFVSSEELSDIITGHLNPTRPSFVRIRSKTGTLTLVGHDSTARRCRQCTLSDVRGAAAVRFTHSLVAVDTRYA